MKIKEVAKINIELTEDEYKTLNSAYHLIEKIGDALDGYGVYTKEYGECIEYSLSGINNILDFIEEGFERNNVEND